VNQILKNLGYFRDESEALAEDDEDPLAELQAASVKIRVAMGRRRG
jgi:hypothetical protein